MASRFFGGEPRARKGYTYIYMGTTKFRQETFVIVVYIHEVVYQYFCFVFPDGKKRDYRRRKVFPRRANEIKEKKKYLIYFENIISIHNPVS